MKNKDTSTQHGLRLWKNLHNGLFMFTVLYNLLAFGGSLAQQTTATSTDEKAMNIPLPTSNGVSASFMSESIDNATGSVALTFAFPTPAGRLLTFPYKLRYASNQVRQHVSFGGAGTTEQDTWKPATLATTCFDLCSNTYDSNSGGYGSSGWSDSVPFATFSTVDIDYETIYGDYSFHGADGPSHLLVGMKGYLGKSGFSPGFHVTKGTGTDGFYSGNLTTQALTVSDSEGTVYHFAANTSQPFSIINTYPATVEDRNGNVVTISDLDSHRTQLTVTDTLGRQALTSNNRMDPSTPNIITSAGQNFTVTWTQVAASSTVTAEPTSVNQCKYGIRAINDRQHVIASIALPTGFAFTFHYGTDNTDSRFTNPYGLINEVDYPNGGWVKYSWKDSDTMSDVGFYDLISQGTILSQRCSYRYKSPVLASRVTGIGSTVLSTSVYTYSTTWGGGTKNLDYRWSQKSTQESITDSITGSTHLITHQYEPGGSVAAPQPTLNYVYQPQDPPVETLTTWYKGAAPGTGVLRQVGRSWYLPDVMNTTVTTLDDGTNATTSACYVSSNSSSCVPQYPVQLSQMDYYDWRNPSAVASSVQVPIKSVLYTYQQFQGIIGTLNSSPCRVVVKDSSGVAGETDYYYDGSITLCSSNGASGVVEVPSPLAITHDETNYSANPITARGNITMKVNLLSGGNSPKVTYTFDKTGQLRSVLDSCGNTQCSDMTASSHLTTLDYSDSFSDTTPTYSTNAFLTSVTRPLIGASTATYRFSDSKVHSLTDVNNVTSTFAYDDPLGRLTQVSGATTVQGQELTTYMYSDGAQSTTVLTTRAASPDPDISSKRVSDGFGRESQLIESAPEGSLTTELGYDAFGHLTSMSNRHLSGDQVRYTTLEYDALGRKTSVTETDGSTQTWTYQGASVTATDERKASWSKTTDVLGRVTTVYEPYVGMFPTVCIPREGCHDQSGARTQYSYDANDNLTSVVQSGDGSSASVSRAYVYDSLSRLVAAQNPETGVICYGSTPTGASPTLSNCMSGYDANGNIGSMVDGRGIRVEYTYDALNRLSTRASNGNLLDEYFYDGQVGQWGSTSLEGASPHAVGRLTFTRSHLFSTNVSCDLNTKLYCDDQYFGYDPVGRMNHRTEAFPSEWGSGADTVDASYNLAGKLHQLTYPNRTLSVSQAYDSLGRLTTVSNSSTGYEYLSVPNYFPSGLPKKLLYGKGQGGGGVVELLATNSREQPCEHSIMLPVGVGGSVILDKQYSYSPFVTQSCADTGNNNGNVYGIADVTNTTLGSDRYSQQLSYDALNRISSFDTASLGGQGRHQDFSYDSYGNLLNMSSTKPPQSGSDPLSFSASYPSGNNRMSPSSFNCFPLSSGTTPQGVSHQTDVYDGAGNVGCTGTQGTDARAFVWDPLNRLSEVWGQSFNNTYVQMAIYSYDAQGNRVRSDQKTIDSSGQPHTQTFREYFSFGGQLLGEKDQDGQWTSYIYANGKRIAIQAAAEHVFATSGVSPGNGQFALVRYMIPQPSNPDGSNYTIKHGDRMCWRQSTSGIFGGPVLWFSNGSDSIMQNLYASDGQQMHYASASSAWANRCVDINPSDANSGASINLTGLMAYDFYGTTSAWSITYADMSILSPDGSVTPVINESGPSSATPYPAYETQLSAGLRLVDIGTEPEEATHYLLSDTLNTAQIEVDGSGIPVWRGETAPFGQELGRRATTNRYIFTGKERDAETGLDTFGTRYYASSMGRWISPDRPFADQQPEDPQSWNMYAYVRNRPTVAIDPTGEALRLVGLTSDARDNELKGIKDSLVKSGQADNLFINAEIGSDGKATGQYFLGVRNVTLTTFASAGALEANLAEIIGSHQIVDFTFSGNVDRYYPSQPWYLSPPRYSAVDGGAATDEADITTSRNIRITIDPGHIHAKLGSEAPNPTTGEAVAHELAHTLGKLRGLLGHKSDKMAVDAENEARRRGTTKENNRGQRKSHDSGVI